MNTRIVASFFASLSLSGALCASTIVTWDFQDDAYTAGSSPSGAGISLANVSGGNQVLVVGPSSTPADPFGGAGNKSLYIQRATADSSTPTLQLNVPGYTIADPLTSGTVSFDLFADTITNGRGSIEVNLGTMNSATSAGRANSFAAFQINMSTANAGTIGRISYFSNTTSGGAITASEFLVPTDTAVNISISWAAGGPSPTYSIYVNGIHALTSDFTVPSVAGLNAIRFTTVNGTTDINYYVDNITVAASPIPEPAHASALLATAAACFTLKRRRVRAGL
jgi:hypothetical protein